MQNISVSGDAQLADAKWYTTTDFSSSSSNSLPQLDFIGPQWKEHEVKISAS